MSHFGSAGSNQDFELNIASIIDCFTVLITYLLVSASFISLGVLSVTVASVNPSAEIKQKTEPSAVQLTILLLQDQSITLQLESETQTDNGTFNLPAIEGKKNLSELIVQLNALKEKYQLNSVVVMAEDQIPYRELVEVLNNVKKTRLQVALKAEGV